MGQERSFPERNYPHNQALIHIYSSVIHRKIAHLAKGCLVHQESPLTRQQLNYGNYLTTWVTDLRETDRVLHRFPGAYDEHIEEGKGDYH